MAVPAFTPRGKKHMSDLNKCRYCGRAFPAVEEACSRCGTQVDCDCNCHGGGTCVGDATTSGAACCNKIGEPLDGFSDARLQAIIDYHQTGLSVRSSETVAMARALKLALKALRPFANWKGPGHDPHLPRSAFDEAAKVVKKYHKQEIYNDIPY